MKRAWRWLTQLFRRKPVALAVPSVYAEPNVSRVREVSDIHRNEGWNDLAWDMHEMALTCDGMNDGTTNWAKSYKRPAVQVYDGARAERVRNIRAKYQLKDGDS